MPKLRIPSSELKTREIVARIHYGMEKQRVTHDELALAARITNPTLYARFKKPGSFRLEELWRISEKLHLPLPYILGEQDMFRSSSDNHGKSKGDNSACPI